MIPDRSFQEYIDFILQAPNFEEVVDVPKDTPAIIRRGADYTDMVSRPGWKHLLDALEQRADVCLGHLRKCESHDPVLVKALRDRWREAEDSLKFVQITVGEAIEQRRIILEELEMRFHGLDISNAPDQRVAEFMNADTVNQTTGEEQ